MNLSCWIIFWFWERTIGRSILSHHRIHYHIDYLTDLLMHRHDSHTDSIKDLWTFQNFQIFLKIVISKSILICIMLMQWSKALNSMALSLYMIDGVRNIPICFLGADYSDIKWQWMYLAHNESFSETRWPFLYDNFEIFVTILTIRFPKKWTMPLEEAHGC
jgi:hypothetical protein